MVENIKPAFFEAFKKIKVYLIIPDLLIIIFSLLSLLYFTTFSQIAGSSLSLEAIISTALNSLPSFGNFIIENWLLIISTIAVFVFFNYFLGSGVLAMKYSMFRDVVYSKPKFNIWLLFTYGGSYFFRVFFLRLLIGLIGTLAFLISVMFFLMLNFVFDIRTSIFWSALLLVMMVILIRFALLFRYALMFLGKKGPYEALEQSFRNLKRKPLLFVATFLIVTLMGFVFNGVAVVVNTLVQIVFSFLGGFTIGVLQRFIAISFNLVFLVWADLFIFILYLKSKF